jgi:hypothetical protein
LSLEELAADKLLALFGRAAARDYEDVAALRRHFSWRVLLELASAKDAGFSVERSWTRSPPSIGWMPSTSILDAPVISGCGSRSLHGPSRSGVNDELAAAGMAASATEACPLPGRADTIVTPHQLEQLGKCGHADE